MWRITPNSRSLTLLLRYPRILPYWVSKGGSSHQVHWPVVPEMIPKPAQKSRVDIPACRGEPGNHLFSFSGAYQPPSKQGCPALDSRHQCAWTRTTPIGVDRVRQVELLERRTWDRRSQGLLEPSRWVETARPQGCFLFLLPATNGGQQKRLKPNRSTYQRHMVRIFLWFVFLITDGQFTGLLISFFFLVWRAVRGIHFVRRKKSRVWLIQFPSILSVSYRLRRRRRLHREFYDYHNC